MSWKETDFISKARLVAQSLPTFIDGGYVKGSTIISRQAKKIRVALEQAYFAGFEHGRMSALHQCANLCDVEPHNEADFVAGQIRHVILIEKKKDDDGL